MSSSQVSVVIEQTRAAEVGIGWWRAHPSTGPAGVDWSRGLLRRLSARFSIETPRAAKRAACGRRDRGTGARVTRQRASRVWRSDLPLVPSSAWPEIAGNWRGLPLDDEFRADSAVDRPSEATSTAPVSGTGPSPAMRSPKRFHGSVALDPARAGRDAGRVTDEVIAHLAGLVGSNVRVTLEIEAETLTGVPDHVVRTVTENARTLKFTSHGFESESRRDPVGGCGAHPRRAFAADRWIERLPKVAQNVRSE